MKFSIVTSFVIFLLSLNISIAQAIKYTDSCTINEAWLHEDYNDRKAGRPNDIGTDFFLLVFSNSPSFCAYQKRKGHLNDVPFQCMKPSIDVNDFGWVVHGLWAESLVAYKNNDHAGHPSYCKGDVPALTFEEMKPYLCTSPGSSLLQNEWEKHGACDFNTPTEYYNKMLELRGKFKLPSANLNVQQSLSFMKRRNPELQNIRLHKTNHEFGICFTTEFELKNCPR